VSDVPLLLLNSYLIFYLHSCTPHLPHLPHCITVSLECHCCSHSMLVYLPYPDLHITSPNSFYGTDGYFAPETLLKFDYSYKTDIW
jgi:serine/threonine protein kinase